MTKKQANNAAITGTFLVVDRHKVILLIATFDWNRRKPTINQKVSTSEPAFRYSRRFRRGVGNAKNRRPAGEAGAVAAYVHAEDVILGNPPDIPEILMVHLPPRVERLAPLALLTKTVWLP